MSHDLNGIRKGVQSRHDGFSRQAQSQVKAELEKNDNNPESLHGCKKEIIYIMYVYIYIYKATRITFATIESKNIMINITENT